MSNFTHKYYICMQLVQNILKIQKLLLESIIKVIRNSMSLINTLSIAIYKYQKSINL